MVTEVVSIKLVRELADGVVNSTRGFEDDKQEWVTVSKNSTGYIEVSILDLEQMVRVIIGQGAKVVVSLEGWPLVLPLL